MATKKTTTAPGKAKKAAVTSSTPVRNTALPKTAPPPLRSNPFDASPPPATTTRRQITHEAIARRAYEISQSPEGRSPEENWFRAERELRNGR
jgi:hypothetical protein